MRRLRPDWAAAPANQRAHTWEEFKKDSEQCRKVVQKPYEQVRAPLRRTEKKKKEKRYPRICSGLFCAFLCLGQRAVTCSSIFKALLSPSVNRQNNRMSTHFRSGPAFGLSAEVKSKLAGKYDPQKEEELRLWIQDVTGKRMGDNFMESLKDGVLLCELINVLQPGSVKRINNSSQNWHQLENIGNFVRAITEYGLKPHDIFEANDLFENVNHTQVQCTLIALVGMAKSKGFHSKYDFGVKYAEKQQRRFAPEKLREGRNIIGLQMGTNKLASQKGMTSYGTRRHLYDAKMGMDNPLDQSTISLQMGTNKGANQSGMTAPGTRRHIFDKKLELENCDTTTISLQMGTNKVASQQGMTTYGLPRQVYDNKYCTNPTETYYNNGSEVEFDGYNQYSD